MKIIWNHRLYLIILKEDRQREKNKEKMGQKKINSKIVDVKVSLVTQLVKNPPAMQETWVSIPELGISPGRGHGNPFQYSCLENLHGQRNLAGYSPWGHKESDMTGPLSKACE